MSPHRAGFFVPDWPPPGAASRPAFRIGSRGLHGKAGVHGEMTSNGRLLAFRTACTAVPSETFKPSAGQSGESVQPVWQDAPNARNVTRETLHRHGCIGSS